MSRAAEAVDDWLRQADLNRDPSIVVDDKESFVLATSRGLVRRENQDRVLVARYRAPDGEEESFTLVALCDGMGGGIQGGRCAELALCSVLDGLLRNDSDDLATSMQEATLAANAAIGSAFQNRGGTTFTGLLHSGTNRLDLVHVGDCRGWRIQPGFSTPELLTEDHNLAAQLARKAGKDANPDDYEHFASQLTQCMGMGGDITPQSCQLEAGEETAFLLSSDGLHCIGSESIAGLAAGSGGLANIAEQLLQASHETGGVDNASLALVTRFSPPEGTAGVLELFSPGLEKLSIPAELTGQLS
jgi:protein phosphatase